MLPIILLLLSCKEDSLDIQPILDGILPVSLFELKSNDDRKLKLPMDDGRLPVNLLELRYKCDILVKKTMVDGILPDKLIEVNDSELSDDIDAKNVGNVPVSLLPESSRVARDVKLIRKEGMIPVKQL
jgi:hypothetical protein